MYKSVKRLFDIVFSVLGLAILLPILLVIAMWIKLESRGPVIFKQERWGRDKTTFFCYKFRTMTIDAPRDVATRHLTEAGNYITRSGAVLRRIGLDEILQLVNVLKGEMSLIGPRPVVLAEEDLIIERDKYGVNALVPGIGGWAQSNGRDNIDFREKARLDGEYAQNFGLKMDFSCAWRTALAIFTSNGFKEGHFGDTSYKHKVQGRTRYFREKKAAVSTRHE